MTEYVLISETWSLCLLEYVRTDKIHVLTFLRSRDAQESQRGQSGTERRHPAGLIPPSVTLTWTEISRATSTHTNVL